jgi:DNA-binding MarR family transcriptional regulator
MYNYLPAQLFPGSRYDVGVEEALRPGRASEVDRITLVGLVFETASGLRRVVRPPLERQCELAGQEFEILVRLTRTPGRRLRMSDLASQTDLTPSGLTRAIDRLSSAGLVDREVCPEDRRGAFAALTAAGEARMNKALDLHRAQLAELLDGVLEPDEELAVTAALRKLRDRVNPGASVVTP